MDQEFIPDITEKEHLHDWVIAALVSQIWGSSPFQQDFVSVIEKDLYLRSATEINRNPADTLQQTWQSTAQGPVHKLTVKRLYATIFLVQNHKTQRDEGIQVYTLPNLSFSLLCCLKTKAL